MGKRLPIPRFVSGKQLASEPKEEAPEVRSLGNGQFEVLAEERKFLPTPSEWLKEYKKSPAFQHIYGPYWPTETE